MCVLRFPEAWFEVSAAASFLYLRGVYMYTAMRLQEDEQWYNKGCKVFIESVHSFGFVS